jgi:hypothetical protein
MPRLNGKEQADCDRHRRQKRRERAGDRAKARILRRAELALADASDALAGQATAAGDFAGAAALRAAARRARAQSPG